MMESIGGIVIYWVWIKMENNSEEVFVVKYDVLVKDGFVVDGTGTPWYRVDVGVKDGRIVEVCRNLPVSGADRVIDAKGLVVCPGFIDMHTHSDYVCFVFPRAEAKIMQGVTSELVGVDGSSPAPLKGIAKDHIKEILRRLELELNWSTLEGYFNQLEGKVSVNIGSFVGFGTVRMGVLGFENRAPTKDELDEMKALVARGMEDGAFGLSTCLMSVPQSFAETDELIELAKVVEKYGGIHHSHDRRRGFEKEPRGGRAFLEINVDTQLESIRECIAIGEYGGIPSHWTHAKAVGKVNWGKTLAACLEELDRARKRGVDVTFDVYPYTWRWGLVRGLPSWAEEGGREKLIERLKDPTIRKELKRIVKRNMEDYAAPHTWKSTIITEVRLDKNKDLIGKSLAEAAEMRGKDPCDLYFDMIIEGDTPIGYSEAMCEDDVRTLIKHPLATICTDGSCGSKTLTHPRSYGTYPKILRKYVREERTLTLEDSIRKMTSACAARLGIVDRGLLGQGFWADITIFDPINVRDRATFQDPLQYPEGIHYVMVNGVLTVDNGEHTGALAGRPLKHK